MCVGLWLSVAGQQGPILSRKRRPHRMMKRFAYYNTFRDQVQHGVCSIEGLPVPAGMTALPGSISTVYAVPGQ